MRLGVPDRELADVLEKQQRNRAGNPFLKVLLDFAAAMVGGDTNADLRFAIGIAFVCDHSGAVNRFLWKATEASAKCNSTVSPRLNVLLKPMPRKPMV